MQLKHSPPASSFEHEPSLKFPPASSFLTSLPNMQNSTQMTNGRKLSPDNHQETAHIIPYQENRFSTLASLDREEKSEENQNEAPFKEVNRFTKRKPLTPPTRDFTSDSTVIKTPSSTENYRNSQIKQNQKLKTTIINLLQPTTVKIKAQYFF